MTRNVLSWLDAAAARAPQASAIEAPDGVLTWCQARFRARQTGSAIAARLPAQTPVLILMEKSAACLVAMLGAVYAGCFYTPLDSSMPEARMRKIADTLHPGMIVYEERFAQTARALQGEARLCRADELLCDIDDKLLDRRQAEQIDEDLLYVLFTSGSTGDPKGVSITHRGVIDFIEWAGETLPLPSGCRMGSQAPFYFDNSVLDIYGTMKTAGCLYLIPRSHFLFPAKLVKTLAEARIDTVFWVPSALTAVANAGVLASQPLPGLRRVFFCGEVMPCRTLNAWRRALPEADFVNMYGPTEITDVCAWYRVTRPFADDDALPIGFACENTRIVLLEGEICVGGTCLSQGYYNDEKRTREAFIQNPLRPQIRETLYRTGDMGAYNERGELMFLGRRDGQIKRSGYRIELGEIECALGAVPGLDAGCCVYDPAREKIVCAWTGAAEEKEIRRALKERVPKYMLPDSYLHLSEMPLTGSGKVDRLAVRRACEHEHPVL